MELGGGLTTDQAWYLTFIVYPAAIVVGSFLAFEVVGRLLRDVAKRAGARPVSLRATRDILRVGWVVVAALGVLSETQLTSQFTVLTISGIGGLLLSLALQTTLSNLVSGLFLLRDRLINVGDLIEYGGVKGRIVRVALRNTWVLTDDGVLAVIGNSSLHGGPLINHTATKRLGLEFSDSEEIGRRAALATGASESSTRPVPNPESR